MNIPELFGDNLIVGSMVSGFVGLAVQEPITANALCTPDNSPSRPVFRNPLHLDVNPA
jgi:hypothetical protein